MKDIDSNFNVIKGKDIIKDGSLGSIDTIEEEFDDQEIEFINNDIFGSHAK